MTKTMLDRRDMLKLAATATLVSRVTLALAQSDWPTKNITLIVPSAAGGAGDFVARTFAQYMQKQLKVVFVVEDRPGASSIIGATAVKSASPDGYTFLISGSTTEAANQSLFTNLPYSAEKDFTEVGLFGVFPMVCVVKPNSPWKSINDIIEQGKAGRPLSYGYYNASSQVPAELLRLRTGMKVLAVAYKNVTQILNDIAGGVIDYAFLDAMGAAPALHGMLRAVAVTSLQRYPIMPAATALAEIVPGFEMQTWSGMTARAGTPPAIIQRMNDYMRAASLDPAVKAALTQHGMTVQHRTSHEQTAFVVEERKRWAEYVRVVGLKPQST